MWTQAKSNRIIYEREKIKDHLSHIDRLRQIKPTITIKAPKKPNHVFTNYKREMQNLERQSDIQYQNRILLRKMLLIDHKHPKSVQKPEAYYALPESNPRGLNAYNSLNKHNRIVEMRKVATDNVSILNRLQNA